MTRFAHLTDMHLDGSRAHRSRFDAALSKAQAFGAEHLLITGDVTGSGSFKEFQEVADALRGWPGHAVTIVPGNHDGHPKRWRDAIAGPLRNFRLTSTPGMFTDVGDAVIVPVSSQLGGRAPLFWAIGHVSSGQVQMLHEIAETSRALGKVMVIAMHHGPQLNLLQPLDGLTNRHVIGDLVRSYPNVWICCGHDHRALDLGQVFVAASVAEHEDPLRTYDVIDGRLVPTYRSEKPGSYLDFLGL